MKKNDVKSGNLFLINFENNILRRQFDREIGDDNLEFFYWPKAYLLILV